MAKRTSHLSKFYQIGREGEKKGKRKREMRKEEKMRERLLLLFSFPRYLTIGVRQSKRQSSFLRRELRRETKIGEFRQAPRRRGFFLLGFCS